MHRGGGAGRGGDAGGGARNWGSELLLVKTSTIPSALGPPRQPLFSSAEICGVVIRRTLALVTMVESTQHPSHMGYFVESHQICVDVERT